MQFEIDAQRLLGGLRTVAYPAGRASQYLHAAVLVEADEHAVTLTTCNGETSASRTLDVEPASTGRIPVAIHTLIDLLGAIGDRSIKVSLVTGRAKRGLSISADGVDVSLVGIDDVLTPPDVVPAQEPGELDPATLDLVRRILPCASQDARRPALCGLRIDGRGFVTTNGERLAFIDFPMGGTPVTVPGEVAQTALRVLADGAVRMWSDGVHVALQSEDADWRLPTVGLPYPNYVKVIPSDQDRPVEITFSVAEMLEALRLAAALVKPSGSVRIDAGGDGELIIEASDPELGEVREMVGCDGEWPTSMPFRVEYLIDALAAMDTDVANCRRSKDVSDSVKITGGRVQHVVMPQTYSSP